MFSSAHLHTLIAFLHSLSIYLYLKGQSCSCLSFPSPSYELSPAAVWDVMEDVLGCGASSLMEAGVCRTGAVLEGTLGFTLFLPPQFCCCFLHVFPIKWPSFPLWHGGERPAGMNPSCTSLCFPPKHRWVRAAASSRRSHACPKQGEDGKPSFLRPSPGFPQPLELSSAGCKGSSKAISTWQNPHPHFSP